MDLNVLVILIMAFGLFSILMFILFYIYAKKYYNDKMVSNENIELDDDIDDSNDSNVEKKEEAKKYSSINMENTSYDAINNASLRQEYVKKENVTKKVDLDDEEFIPMKKK